MGKNTMSALKNDLELGGRKPLVLRSKYEQIYLINLYYLTIIMKNKKNPIYSFASQNYGSMRVILTVYYIYIKSRVSTVQDYKDVIEIIIVRGESKIRCFNNSLL